MEATVAVPAREPQPAPRRKEPEAPTPEVARDQSEELLLRPRLEQSTAEGQVPDAPRDELNIVKGVAQFGEDGLGLARTEEE